MTSRPPAVSKKGTEITEDVADELAREAERGYDLEQGRRVGRRSLAGGAGKSPRLNIRTTPALYEQARRRAERDGKTISAIAREALERYVS